ncbi:MULTISPECIES: hypothetical protein [unclassified Streptomyces]|uniref:Uncharacterized protein n=1 Tax=Streptomyces sp. NBC_00060 TaxID=2975636 RepID=A0AAU2GTW4_9ACTN
MTKQSHGPRKARRAAQAGLVAIAVSTALSAGASIAQAAEPSGTPIDSKTQAQSAISQAGQALTSVPEKFRAPAQDKVSAAQRIASALPEGDSSKLAQAVSHARDAVKVALKQTVSEQIDDLEKFRKDELAWKDVYVTELRALLQQIDDLDVLDKDYDTKIANFDKQVKDQHKKATGRISDRLAARVAEMEKQLQALSPEKQAKLRLVLEDAQKKVSTDQLAKYRSQPEEFDKRYTTAVNAIKKLGEDIKAADDTKDKAPIKDLEDRLKKVQHRIPALPDGKRDPARAKTDEAHAGIEKARQAIGTDDFKAQADKAGTQVTEAEKALADALDKVADDLQKKIDGIKDSSSKDAPNKALSNARAQVADAARKAGGNDFIPSYDAANKALGELSGKVDNAVLKDDLQKQLDNLKGRIDKQPDSRGKDVLKDDVKDHQKALANLDSNDKDAGQKAKDLGDKLKDTQKALDNLNSTEELVRLLRQSQKAIVVLATEQRDNFRLDALYNKSNSQLQVTEALIKDDKQFTVNFDRTKQFIIELRQATKKAVAEQ